MAALSDSLLIVWNGESKYEEFFQKWTSAHRMSKYRVVEIFLHVCVMWKISKWNLWSPIALLQE